MGLNGSATVRCVHCDIVTDTRHLQAPAEDTSFRCFPYLTHLY